MATDTKQAVDAAADYRFGWHWLLPSEPRVRTHMLGLCAADKEWWKQKRDGEPIAECVGYAVLADLDRAEMGELSGHIADPRTAWVCVWGDGGQVRALRRRLRDFPDVREYSLLPASRPRLVIPTTSAAAARRGLDLHRPGRVWARVAVYVAYRLFALGYSRFLCRRTLLIASRACAGYGMSAPQHALYLGNCGDNRKTIVLQLEGNGSAVKLLKIADRPKAMRSLSHEAETLRHLSGSTVSHRIPRVLEYRSSQTTVVLTQEYRARKPASKRRMLDAATTFLEDLSYCNRSSVALAAMLSPSRVGTESARSLEGRLRAVGTAGASVLRCRTHGDFAPWNCSWTEDGFFVYDWEDSRSDGLALTDFFYYKVAPFVHIAGTGGAKDALAVATWHGKQLAVAVGIPPSDVQRYLGLWLLERMTQHSFYRRMIDELDRSWV